MRILFAENHSIFARLAVEQFLAEHDVVLLATVADVCATASAKQFDIALVDYDLDDGKGTDVVSWLREHGFKGAIIGVSAREEGNRELLRAGASTVCPKVELHTIGRLIGAAPAHPGGRSSSAYVEK